ncbi:MAG: YkgJ family cysteine cluster protein [Thermodesulfobacteriota bacterium]
MKPVAPDKIDALPGERLAETDTFRFACHDKLACFNQCCRNLNLFLYPYDVLRLRKALNMTAGEFIDRHVDVVMRPENFFPDVLLSMADNPEKTCPFLTVAGCGVYQDRSYSCRLFPMEQGMIMADNAAEPQILYFFRPPAFCLGRHEDRVLTPARWIDDQEAETYVRMTRRWAEVKALFSANPWGAAGPYGPAAKMAFMAAYNMDAFRDFVFNSGFLKRYKVKPVVLQKLRASDAELMLFGFDWIKLFVWGIKSDRIRLK